MYIKQLKISSVDYVCRVEAKRWKEGQIQKKGYNRKEDLFQEQIMKKSSQKEM